MVHGLVAMTCYRCWSNTFSQGLDRQSWGLTGVAPQDILRAAARLELLLVTQYFDMLREVGVNTRQTPCSHLQLMEAN